VTAKLPPLALPATRGRKNEKGERLFDNFSFVEKKRNGRDRFLLAVFADLALDACRVEKKRKKERTKRGKEGGRVLDI